MSFRMKGKKKSPVSIIVSLFDSSGRWRKIPTTEWRHRDNDAVNGVFFITDTNQDEELKLNKDGDDENLFAPS